MHTSSGLQQNVPWQCASCLADQQAIPTAGIRRVFNAECPLYCCDLRYLSSDYWGAGGLPTFNDNPCGERRAQSGLLRGLAIPEVEATPCSSCCLHFVRQVGPARAAPWMWIAAGIRHHLLTIFISICWDSYSNSEWVLFLSNLLKRVVIAPQ